MTDNISGIFDNLEPGDFFVETTAIDETPGSYVGEDAFNSYIEEKIRQIKVNLSASAGQMNPVAYLSSPTLSRAFTPEQDETLGDFLERLKREARAMGATWLFLAKKNVFAVTPAGEGDLPDVNSPEAESAAKSLKAEEEVGILWFAERRDRTGEMQHRQGVLHLNNLHTQVVGRHDGDQRQTFAVFSLILDATIRS